MAIVYEAIAITGTYTDKNGEEKKRWVKCGVVMSTKSGGLTLKLEALPTVFDGWISLVEPKEKESDAPPPAARPATKPRPSLTDDQIPFAPRDNRGDFW